MYGFMPAKATIFNLRCDPVFDIGIGPRNAAYYSPSWLISISWIWKIKRTNGSVGCEKLYKLI